MDEVKKNPHCLQILDDPTKLTINTFTESNLHYYNSLPKAKYKRMSTQRKTLLHHGQRKLLLGEMLLLNKVRDDYYLPLVKSNKKISNLIVIYIGAAPGIHTNLLISMYSFISKWILIDPSKIITKHEKVIIINDLFNVNLATKLRNEYKDSSIIYISDIRSKSNDTESPSDDDVLKDTKLQNDGYYIFKPIYTLFKFRDSYTIDNKIIQMPKGKIYLQSRCSKTSTETRYLITGYTEEKIEFENNGDYENILFYHNRFTRASLYPHNIRAAGIDMCYDCAYEIYLINQYLQGYYEVKRDKTIEYKLSKEIVEFIQKIDNCVHSNNYKETYSFGYNNIYSYLIYYLDLYYGLDIDKYLATQKRIVKNIYL